MQSNKKDVVECSVKAALGEREVMQRACHKTFSKEAILGRSRPQRITFRTSQELSNHEMITKDSDNVHDRYDNRNTTS